MVVFTIRESPNSWEMVILHLRYSAVCALGGLKSTGFLHLQKMILRCLNREKRIDAAFEEELLDLSGLVLVRTSFLPF